MKRLSLLGVYVKNQDAAIEFYTKKLGFILAEDVPFGPQRWVTLRLRDDEVVSISLRRGPVQLCRGPRSEICCPARGRRRGGAAAARPGQFRVYASQ
jgi:catechol 2,3-dioxygenase-like lactoylglutathione lyase family enzyme